MTTWNPSDKSANVTLSNGNLTATGGSADGGVRGTTSKSSGKWYFEITFGGTVAGNDSCVGIATATASLPLVANTGSASSVFYPSLTDIFFNGSFITNTPYSFVAGNVMSIAVDLTNGRMWWNKNGAGGNSWVGDSNAANGNPATNLHGLSIGGLFPTNAAFPVFGSNSTTFVATANFGGSAFSFTPPSGFSAWDPPSFVPPGKSGGAPGHNKQDKAVLFKSIQDLDRLRREGRFIGSLAGIVPYQSPYYPPPRSHVHRPIERVEMIIAPDGSRIRRR